MPRVVIALFLVPSLLGGTATARQHLDPDPDPDPRLLSSRSSHPVRFLIRFLAPRVEPDPYRPVCVASPLTRFPSVSIPCIINLPPWRV